MVYRSLLLVLAMAGFAMADTGFKDSIQFTEADGSPKCMAGQVVVGNGQLTCAGNKATLTITGGGGGGGSSSLAVTVGVARSSPTSDLMFNPNQFSGSISGSSITVSLQASSVTLQGQNVIKLASTLQSGATMYTSSGTVVRMHMDSGVIYSNTEHRSGGAAYFYGSGNSGAGTINNPGAPSEQMLRITASNGVSVNQSPVNGVDLTLASQRVTGLTASQGVRTNANKNLVSGGPLSTEIPGGATSYIQNTSDLQSGSVFFVSSGTVQGKQYFTNATSNQQTVIYHQDLPMNGGFGPQAPGSYIENLSVNDGGTSSGISIRTSTQTPITAAIPYAAISVTPPASTTEGSIGLNISTFTNFAFSNTGMTMPIGKKILMSAGASIQWPDGTIQISSPSAVAPGSGDNLGNGTGSFGVSASTGGFSTTLTIPQGTGPTISASGNLALDTSAGQLVAFVGSEAQVVGTSTRAISVTISSGTGWSGRSTPFKFPVLGAVTITRITAETLPSGSTVQYQLDERAFGSIGSAGTSVFSVAFSSGNATGVTETSFSNAGIASQASLVLTTPSGSTASAGTPTALNVTIYFKEDRQ